MSSTRWMKVLSLASLCLPSTVDESAALAGSSEVNGDGSLVSEMNLFWSCFKTPNNKWVIFTSLGSFDEQSLVNDLLKNAFQFQFQSYYSCCHFQCKKSEKVGRMKKKAEKIRIVCDTLSKDSALDEDIRKFCSLIMGGLDRISTGTNPESKIEHMEKKVLGESLRLLQHVRNEHERSKKT